eukprot:SAG31_NODE_4274_length_3387_cov_41.794708_2_plen_585_part_00
MLGTVAAAVADAEQTPAAVRVAPAARKNAKALVSNATDRQIGTRVKKAAAAAKDLTPNSKAKWAARLAQHVPVKAAFDDLLDRNDEERLETLIGQRVITTFQHLAAIREMAGGAPKEKRTAAAIQDALLASLARSKDEEDADAHGQIMQILALLGLKPNSRNYERYAEAAQAGDADDWLPRLCTDRQIRSDCKLRCPAVVELVTELWGNESNPSPLRAHADHREPGYRLRKGGTLDKSRVHDLHLVTFGAADVHQALKNDAGLQARLKEIGTECSIPRLAKGEGLSLRIINALRPWWCVTLSLTDMENCIDRYIVEFKQLIKVAKTVRSLQKHGTKDCKCQKACCRPPDENGQLPEVCQLQQLAPWNQVLQCTACDQQKVIVVEGDVDGNGEVSASFPPLGCWRNLGGCSKCYQCTPTRCESFERDSAEERQFLGFTKIEQKRKQKENSAGNREAVAAKRAVTAAEAHAAQDRCVQAELPRGRDETGFGIVFDAETLEIDKIVEQRYNRFVADAGVVEGMVLIKIDDVPVNEWADAQVRLEMPCHCCCCCHCCCPQSLDSVDTADTAEHGARLCGHCRHRRSCG